MLDSAAAASNPVTPRFLPLALSLILTSVVFATGCDHQAQRRDKGAPAVEHRSQKTATVASASAQPTSDAKAPRSTTHSSYERTVSVIFLARDIPAGTPVTEDRVETRKIRKSDMPPKAVWKGEFPIYLGAVVCRNVDEGHALREDDFKGCKQPIQTAPRGQSASAQPDRDGAATAPTSDGSKTVSILVLTRDMSPGSTLMPDNVTTRTVKRGDVPPHALTKPDLEIWMGQPTCQHLKKGEVATTDKFTCKPVSKPDHPTPPSGKKHEKIIIIRHSEK